MLFSIHFDRILMRASFLCFFHFFLFVFCRLLFCRWGGPTYKATAATVDLYLGGWSMLDLIWHLYDPTPIVASASTSTAASIDPSQTAALVNSHIQFVILRVPFEYNHSKLASHLVRVPPSLIAELEQILSTPTSSSPSVDKETITAELTDLLKQWSFKVPRPHPFKMLLEKVVLLFFAFPSRLERQQARLFMIEQARLIVARRHVNQMNESSTSASSSASSTHSAADTTVADATTSSSSLPPLNFTLSNLDSLIYMLNAYNVYHQGESDPSFFDWEKQRWIATRRWKGCTLEPAKKVHDPTRQAILAMEGAHKKAGQGKRSEREIRRQQERKEKLQAKKQAKIAAKAARQNNNSTEENAAETKHSANHEADDDAEVEDDETAAASSSAAMSSTSSN